MKIARLLILILLSTEVAYSQKDDLVLAKRIKISSAILGEERAIFVSTPSGYNESMDSYPVMYVLDGVTEVIGLVKYLTDYDVCPEMIIVSIEEVNSSRDMFPSKPKYRRGTQPAKPWYNNEEDGAIRVVRENEKIGEADKYLLFIETELFPVIEKNYRTVPYRICCGHSKGGLCVTHVFLSYIKMFNAYIALNPSLYWDDGLVMKAAAEKLGGMNLQHKLFYFDIGENEVPSTIGDAFTFAQTIRENASSDLRWKLDYLPKESHGSGTAVGLINALKFIYDGWHFDENKIKIDGLKAIDSFYNNLSERFGYQISPNVGLLNSLGWSYLREDQYEEALLIFKDNVRRFPDSPDAYNFLGEGYLAAGKIEMSINSYEKAAELATKFNTGNAEFLKQRIESIKTKKK